MLKKMLNKLSLENIMLLVTLGTVLMCIVGLFAIIYNQPRIRSSVETYIESNNTRCADTWHKGRI